MTTYQTVTDRRRGLVDAAVRVISTEGVAKATTRRIADEAGVSGAIVHYAYATKDDLFQAVYESLTASAFGEIGTHAVPGVGLEAGIQNVLAGFVTWIRRDPNSVLALLELTAWSLRTPSSRHLASRVYGRHIDLTAGLLAEAAPGVPRETLQLVARLVNMALDGIYLQWRALGDDSLDRLTPLALEMITTQARQLPS
jgi:AcrR family transcriptional regulator